MSQPGVSAQSKAPLLQQMADRHVAIHYLGGTIASDEVMRMKRMVYRVTRGKAYTFFKAISPQDLREFANITQLQNRTVYMITF